jgi:hypothetical protein
MLEDLGWFAGRHDGFARLRYEVLRKESVSVRSTVFTQFAQNWIYASKRQRACCHFVYPPNGAQQDQCQPNHKLTPLVQPLPHVPLQSGSSCRHCCYLAYRVSKSFELHTPYTKAAQPIIYHRYEALTNNLNNSNNVFVICTRVASDMTDLSENYVVSHGHDESGR